jgi:glycolate oxidase
MISFGHAGDGNVHLCVVRGDRDDETWERELDENLTVVYRKAYALGGLASGEHGIGLSKQKYMLEAANPANIALMKRVKAAFDEKHILNAGISYDA